MSKSREWKHFGVLEEFSCVGEHWEEALELFFPFWGEEGLSILSSFSYLNIYYGVIVVSVAELGILLKGHGITHCYINLSTFSPFLNR